MPSIGNENIELSIDAQSGGITQILNKRTNTTFLKFPSDQIAYLWFLQKGKKSNLYANDDEPVKAINCGRSTLRGVGVIRGESCSSVEVHHKIWSTHVLCRFRLDATSQLIECEVEVDNSSQESYSEDIVGVGFPQLRGICIGHDSSDDILVRPNRFGEIIRDPVGNAGKYHKSLLYGGFASMMWMDIYDSSSGLYVASYDRELILTALESIPDCETKTMTLGMRKYAYVPAGAIWKSSPFVIGVHDGDWHWAADRYREWAESWMRKPAPPEKIKWSDGWYGVCFKRGKEIVFRFEDIEDLYRGAQYLGLDHVQFWGQMVGDGCCYRFYYPDPRLGSIEELKEAISSIKKMGGSVGFYFNIQAFSPYVGDYLEMNNIRIPESVKIPSWLEEFREYAQINFDGSATVQYPGRELENDGFRIMCTYARGWQEYLLHWVVERYLKEYGANFAYIDQAFSPPVSYCFNFRHGHPHHGCSAQGRVTLVRMMSEEGRKFDPDFSICIEGNGDSIGQYCDFHLYTSFSSQTRFPAPEVFAYTFPWYIIIDGFANNPVDWIGKCYYPDIEREVEPEDLINRIYLLGFKFDVTPLLPDVRMTKGERLTEYYRKLIYLRKKVKAIQYESRFMDDVGVKAHARRVVVKAFLGFDKRKMLINLIDYRSERGPFKIEVDSPTYRLGPRVASRLLGIDDQEIDLKIELTSNKLLINVPPFNGTVASIILENMS